MPTHLSIIPATVAFCRVPHASVCCPSVHARPLSVCPISSQSAASSSFTFFWINVLINIPMGEFALLSSLNYSLTHTHTHLTHTHSPKSDLRGTANSSLQHCNANSLLYRCVRASVCVCVLVYGWTPGVMSDIRVYVVDEESVLWGALWSSKIHQISPSLKEKRGAWGRHCYKGFPP